MDNQELNHSSNENTAWDEKHGKEEGTPKNQVLSDGKPFEGSGKQQGLVDPPIVTMHKQKLNQSDKPEPIKINEINPKLLINNNYNHPFDDIEVGGGLFIPNPPNMTVDKHILQVHKQVAAYQELNSEIEKDKDGDNIREQVIIEERKTNPDGTYQIDAKGDAIVGANSGSRYKRIYYQTFVVRPVSAGDDVGQIVDSDGVMVIRLA